MATKTVVCPDCGSESAPGRYTCGECGAFLDGVAVAPRVWEPAPAGTAPDAATEAEPSALADTDADLGPDPAEADAAPVPAWPERPIMPSYASATANVPEPEPGEWLPEAADPLLEDGPFLDPVDATLPPPPDALHEVQWAAPGGRAPLPAPEPRVPAGAYLPPSALLTGLEPPDPATPAAAMAVGGAAALASPARGADADRSPRDWLAALGTPDRRWPVARRTIAIGSAVTVVGFLLPWASGSASSLLTFWTQIWGLAGPAHWLVVAAVAALGLVAAWTSPRTASWPLGLPSIVLATFVLGLIWGTLLGAAQRPIGVLVVLVGVIVLAVGGAIHLDARHEAATPDV